MKRSENMIISEGIARKAPGIVHALSQNSQPSRGGWYAVISAPEPDHLMYIISSREYRLPLYHSDRFRLLGLAPSHKEALKIVQAIVEKGFRSGSLPKMKHFVEEF